MSDARALEAQATTLQYVDLELGGSVGPTVQQRVFYRTLKTKPIVVLGTSEFFAEGTRIPFLSGRFFNGTELQYRKNVVVLAYAPYQRLFGESGIDPIGKTVRIGNERFEVVGAFGKRPSPGGFSGSVDDFVVIPHTTYQRVYGLRVARVGNLGTISNIQISVVPREGISAQTAMNEIQNIMRSRHGLKLDEPDDFDLFTQDSILKLYERVSQAILFALVVISSIALMVGGIGVMAIMSISVTERTREIGVRKALGRTPGGNPVPVPDGGRLPDLPRRRPRHRPRQRHRPAHPPGFGIPGVAPLVVVRHRPRLLRLGGHLFRLISRLQGLPSGPDRSASLRIAPVPCGPGVASI